ncbi:hypothetical protein [Microlunatus sp. Gsoil 973]|uniref:hypothetical protein n=1 Tax=Microlunatus sp. Gsoil 973 TaxID=2672569 RepID=UPI0012B4A46B|nr:hypothetical protein [Microlunatus sp. Gsoil 973]QGN35035.1 hypothetical protein GJV80_21885 [Microlunatus sp. Gsoil 973]
MSDSPREIQEGSLPNRFLTHCATVFAASIATENWDLLIGGHDQCDDMINDAPASDCANNGGKFGRSMEVLSQDRIRCG